MSEYIKDFINQDLDRLEELMKKYPRQLSCDAVADLLGCKPEGVRQAIAEGAFGIHWRLSGKLTSGNCIPTGQFVRWYLNYKIA